MPLSLCPPQIPVVGLAYATRGRRLDGLNLDTAHSLCDVTTDLLTVLHTNTCACWYYMYLRFAFWNDDALACQYASECPATGAVRSSPRSQSHHAAVPTVTSQMCSDSVKSSLSSLRLLCSHKIFRKSTACHCTDWRHCCEPSGHCAGPSPPPPHNLFPPPFNKWNVSHTPHHQHAFGASEVPI